MDDIRPQSYKRAQPNGTGRHVTTRAVATKDATANSSMVFKKKSKLGKKHIRRVPVGINLHSALKQFRKTPALLKRAIYIVMVFIVLSVPVGSLQQSHAESTSYNLSTDAQRLIGVPSDKYANKLVLDSKSNVIRYNQDYVPQDTKGIQSSSPKIVAEFSVDPKEGAKIVDPVNRVGVSFTPKFEVQSARKDKNRVLYPLKGTDAIKVYSLKATGMKEDLIINSFQGDSLEFTYKLGLSDGLEARMEQNGALGVYGVESVLLGNVSTSTDQDVELLKKARNNNYKNQLLFTVPAPFIVEANRKNTTARAWFSLKNGNELTVHADGLKNATYPLSIDPSVYVETAVKFMRGNNESNVDFDFSNELIQKSQTTGARIEEWTDATDINNGSFNHTMAAYNGYLYRAGGTTSRVMPRIVGKQESTQSTNSGSFVMTMPSTRPANDLYVALMCHDGTGSAVTGPSGGGWTEYADTREFAAYYKIGANVSGGNEAASYTWTMTTGGTTEEWAGVILRIKNFDSSDILSGSAATTSGAADAVPVYPAVTPDTQGTLLLRGTGFDQDQPPSAGWSPTSGHSGIQSGWSGNGSSGPCGYAVDAVDSPPASGSSTGTATLLDPGSTESFRIFDTYGSASIAINGVTASSTNTTSVYWAKMNNSTGSIDSPTTGAGACTNWCTDSAYDLPAARLGATMVAYNGYLYVMGGTDGAGTRQSSVYIAKLGANGEPQKWSPLSDDTDDWSYWYQDDGLNGGTARSYFSAIAANNRMYVVGGQTNAATSGTTAVEMAEITPAGTLSTWTTTNIAQLGTGRHGHSMQFYNNVMYIVGGFEGAGTSSANLRATVLYSKINPDGTTNAWTSTSSFTTARSTGGGNMTAIWGGYLYLAGGCAGVNGSGYCTTIAEDTQLASINADGSLAEWNVIPNLRNQRFGYSFVAWQGALYRFGGCSKQDTASTTCYGSHIETQYGVINDDGDASTVSNSEPANSGECVSANSYANCDLPAAGTGAEQGGQMSSMIVVNNSYIYVIGGCRSVASNDVCESSGSSRTSGNVLRASISSTGKIVRPATCSGGTYVTNSSWCVDSTNRINGATGIAAGGATVFNNTIYVVGGTNGADWQSNVYRVGLSSDGSLSGAWSSQSLNSLGLTGTADDARGYVYTFTRANPSSAGSNPGNLYILGGCYGAASTSDGIGCQNYATETIKCNIASAGSLNTCSTTGQMQLDADDINSGSQGIGLMAGTVYANRIYLVGGACTEVNGDGDTNDPEDFYPCGEAYSGNRKDTIFAMIDDSNNIVDVDNGLSSGTWNFTSGEMDPVRRRAVSFGYNGYIYSLAGYSGTASLEDLLFAKIDVSTGDMGDFASSGVVVTPRWDLRAIVSNGYVYAIGGCAVGTAPSGCTEMQEEVQTFQLYNNDSGAAQAYTNMSDNDFTTDINRWGASSAIYTDTADNDQAYLYVAGGCISATDCTDATNSVQYAPISKADGSVGTWASAGTLPGDRAWGQLEQVGGSLYYIGGQDDTATNEQSTVYYTTAITAGVPTWSGSTATNSLPAARTQHAATVWNDRIYVLGGLDGSAAVSSTVYVSPSLSSGGNINSAWSTTSTSFDVARSGAAAIAYANNLYIFGGYDGTNYLSDVQFSQINSSTGDAGAWTFSTSLPAGLRQADGFAYNGYMYLVGGRSASTTCPSNTLIAPISANTTIASGNDPTGIGDWYETNQRYPGYRYGAAVAYNKGKLYMSGGGCSTYVGPDYTTGTISQTGTAITGAGGASWNDSYVGATIRYSDLTTATITAVSSATTMTSSVSKTVAALSTYTLITYRGWYTSLKAQPQIAEYSRMIDTDTDVFPTDWLMNGLDNSIGARWQMRYRSSADGFAGGTNKMFDEDFEGGANGAALDDTGGGTHSVDYDNCYVTGTGTMTHTTAWAIDGTKSGNYNVASGTGSGACENTFGLGLVTRRFERFYIRFNGNPPANTVFYRIVNSTNGEVLGELRIMGVASGSYVAGDLQFRAGASGTTAVTPTLTTGSDATPPLNTGATGQRIEVGLYNDEMHVRMFQGSNIEGNTPDWEGYTSLANSTNDFNRTSVGMLTSVSSAWSVWVDSHEAAHDSWVGTENPEGVVWGEETNYGNVTLGTPDDFVPLDEGGTNTNFARWYFFKVNIDASQTFGYPEDVERGPTINDLSLFFTADPSKRMRHGKTFTGGEKQPLDTPF